MVPPKGAYWPILKLHSILAVANLLAHNNKKSFVTAVKFHYRVLQLLPVNSSFSETFGGNIYFAGGGTLMSR